MREGWREGGREGGSGKTEGDTRETERIVHYTKFVFFYDCV